MHGFALAGRKIHSFRQTLGDHSFFFAEFIPGAQSRLAAALALRLELIVHHFLSSWNSAPGFFVLV
jgi:hypothetical protein